MYTMRINKSDAPSTLCPTAGVLIEDALRMLLPPLLLLLVAAAAAGAGAAAAAAAEPVQCIVV
jgi:hypothetical protein